MASQRYTLSLPDALPIYGLLNGTTPHKATLNVEPRSVNGVASNPLDGEKPNGSSHRNGIGRTWVKQKLRSEEHTSELQSRGQLVCRRPLEKKNPQTV